MAQQSFEGDRPLLGSMARDHDNELRHVFGHPLTSTRIDWSVNPPQPTQPANVPTTPALAQLTHRPSDYLQEVAAQRARVPWSTNGSKLKDVNDADSPSTPPLGWYLKRGLTPPVEIFGRIVPVMSEPTTDQCTSHQLPIGDYPKSNAAYDMATPLAPDNGTSTGSDDEEIIPSRYGDLSRRLHESFFLLQFNEDFLVNDIQSLPILTVASILNIPTQQVATFVEALKKDIAIRGGSIILSHMLWQHREALGIKDLSLPIFDFDRDDINPTEYVDLHHKLTKTLQPLFTAAQKLVESNEHLTNEQQTARDDILPLLVEIREKELQDYSVSNPEVIELAFEDLQLTREDDLRTLAYVLYPKDTLFDGAIEREITPVGRRAVIETVTKVTTVEQ